MLCYLRIDCLIKLYCICKPCKDLIYCISPHYYIIYQQSRPEGCVCVCVCVCVCARLCVQTHQQSSTQMHILRGYNLIRRKFDTFLLPCSKNSLFLIHNLPNSFSYVRGKDGHWLVHFNLHGQLFALNYGKWTFIYNAFADYWMLEVHLSDSPIHTHIHTLNELVTFRLLDDPPLQCIIFK